MKKVFKNLILILSIKKIFFLFLLIFLIFTKTFAQDFKSIEFKNQEVKDILFILAQQNEISVSTDETVQGKADFSFSNADYQNAFKTFLESQNFFYEVQDGVYKISKIKCSFNTSANKIFLECKDTSIKSVFNKIAQKTQ